MRIETTNKAGKFILYTPEVFTGGPNTGKTWESTSVVYSNRESLMADKLSDNQHNVIITEIETLEINGQTFLKPSFNVWG